MASHTLGGTARWEAHIALVSCTLQFRVPGGWKKSRGRGPVAHRDLGRIVEPAFPVVPPRKGVGRVEEIQHCLGLGLRPEGLAIAVVAAMSWGLRHGTGSGPRTVEQCRLAQSSCWAQYGSPSWPWRQAHVSPPGSVAQQLSAFCLGPLCHVELF